MKKRKVISGLVALFVLFTALTPVSVFAYTDVTGHWANEAITRWTEANVIQGEDNSFRPDDSITRAETATVLDHVIGYQDTAENIFQDVKQGSWYETSVLKLNAAGVMNGDGDGSMRPEAMISREEAVVMFARAFGLNTSQGAITQYGDAAEVSPWAVKAVAQMTYYGYIQGDNGTLRPKDAITRAEVVTMLDQMVGLYAQDGGEYQGNYGRKIAIIKSGGTVLLNAIFGGAIISPEVGNGTVTIKNTQINGTLVQLAAEARIDTVGSIIESSTKPDQGGSSQPNFIGGGNSSGSAVQTYTVTYHGNGGKWSSASDKRIDYRRGAKLSSKAPVDPTWSGHTFIGWYQNANAADMLNDSQLVNMSQTVTKNMAVYAGWQLDSNATPTPVPTPKPEEITVRFLSNAAEIASTQTIKQGETVKAPEEPTRKGFDFEGWYYGPTAASRQYQSHDVFDQSTDLYAVWNVQEEYQDLVTDVTAAEEEENSQTEVYPQQVLAGEPIRVMTVTAKGYTTEKPVITYQKMVGDAVTTVTVPAEQITKAADGSYTYVVPEGEEISNIQVAPVVVKATYAVTIQASEHGTVVSDKTTAQYQEQVTLSVNPAQGYELKALSVTQNSLNIEFTEAANKTFLFEMPDADVLVTAVFQETSVIAPTPVPSATPTAEPTATPTAEPTATPAPVDSSARITISPSTDLYGKSAAELMNQVRIQAGSSDNSFAVSGRLNYISGYTDWSSVAEDQSGYYLAIDLTLPDDMENPEEAVVIYQGTEDAKTYRSFTENDKILTTVWRVTDLNTRLSYTVDLDGEGSGYLPVVYQIDLTALTLQTLDWSNTGNHLAVVPVGEVYEINTAEELAWLANQISTGELGAVKVKLINDIDLKNMAWSPIGTSEHPFSGVFDGDFKEIKNLKIEKSVSAEAGDSPAYFALFGSVKGTKDAKAEIKNLTVTGNVTNTTAFDSIENPDDIGRYTALVAAEAAYTDLFRIVANGSVSSSCKTVGGILAKAVVPAEEDGTLSIRDCVSNVNVTGTYQTGGIVAYTRAASEKGTVEILRCANYGTITSDITAGGIAGLTGRTNILQSKNAGDVVTTDSVKSGNVGGIVGIFNGGNIGFQVKDCYNTGAVTSAAGAAAGIMGMDSTGLATIQYCYNAGAISTGNVIDGKATSAGIYGGTSGTFTTNFVNNYYLDGTAEYGACFGYLPNPDTSNVKITGKPDQINQFEGMTDTQLKEAGGLLNHGEPAVTAAWRNAPAGVNQGYPVLNWEYPDAQIPPGVTAVTDLAGFQSALHNENLSKIIVKNKITLESGIYGSDDESMRKAVVLHDSLILPKDSDITIQNLDFTTPDKQIVTNMLWSDASDAKTVTLKSNTVTGAFACVLPDFLSGTVTIQDNIFTDTYSSDGSFVGDIVSNTGLTTREHNGLFVVTGNTFQGYGIAVTYAVDSSKLTFEKNRFLDNNTNILPMGSGVVDARYNYFQNSEPKILTGYSVYEPYYTNPECTVLSEKINSGKAYLISTLDGKPDKRIAQINNTTRIYLPEEASCAVEVIPFDGRDTVSINSNVSSTATVNEIGTLNIQVGEKTYTVSVVNPTAVDADVYIATTLEGLNQANKVSFTPPENLSNYYLTYTASMELPVGEYLYVKIDSLGGLNIEEIGMQNEKGTFSFECENNIAKIPYELANAPFGKYDSLRFSMEGGNKLGNYEIRFTNTASEFTPMAYDFSDYIGVYQPQSPLENSSGIEIKDIAGVVKGGLTDEITKEGTRPDISALSDMSSAYDKDGALKYQQFKVGYSGNCYLAPGTEQGTLVVMKDVKFRKSADEVNTSDFTGFIPKGTVFVKQS